MQLEIFTQHPIAWSLLLLLLLSLVYAMRAIKKEKEIFIENAKEIVFGPYLLNVPSWWTITAQTESFLKFERTDTRYDWVAIFKLDELNKCDKTIIEEFTDEIHAHNLLFDSDAGVIHEPSSMKVHALTNCEVARVEGTATQNGIERLYFDAMLARDHELKKRIWAESKSSVLNGLVEGPYFEYVIQNFKRK